MSKEMLINVSEGEECRIALLADGKLEELYMERTSSTSHVGNIYKGRVTNVEPSIQAAFIDFGLGRNGFLHISDLMPTYFGRRGEDIQETVGRKMARRDRPPIQRCLRRGDEIIVQIIKEGIGTKGPTLSTYLSIPGKILVMMPGMGKMGVSKKIEDDQERRRLRQILDGLKPPKDVAFIIRTAGIGKTKTEIERDLKYLTRLWEQIEKKQKEPAPVELYTEGDLVTRTVRDVFSSDVDKLIVDNKDVAKRVKDVIKISSPRTKNKVELYEDPIPLFSKYEIEREIELMYSRHVPLPSGGSLVIDSTEAIVAIDVNSGKFRDHSDAEMTAFKTDMEAADEIPRQLKLRDLGGVIICDFIDLRYERHRRELEKRLHDNFKNDRAKTKVLRMSQFGIIELTRQRMRPSLKRSIYFDCPHCKGAGLVKTPESMSLDVMRRLAIALNDLKVSRAELSVCPDVSFYLLNKKRGSIARLEERTKKKILIRTDQTLGLDEMKFELFDVRDGLVILEELGMTMPAHPHTTQLGTRPAGQHGRGGGRHDHRGGGRGGPPGRDQRGGGRPGQQQRRDQRPQPTREAELEREDMDEDRLAIERGEEAVEQREEEMGYESSHGPAERESDSPGIPAVLETESGDEVAEELADEKTGAAGPDASGRPSAPRPQGQGQQGQDQEGGGGRRRRRRGRRGRGRGGNGQGGGQPPGGPPRDLHARVAGKLADGIANEFVDESEDADHEDDRNREPAEGTPNMAEASDDIGPAAEGGESETSDDINTAAGARQGGGAIEGGEGGDQPRRRRRRRGGRRHRRRNGNGGNEGNNGEPVVVNDEDAAPEAEAEEASEEEPSPGNEREAQPQRRSSRSRSNSGGGGGGNTGGSRRAPQRIPPKQPATATPSSEPREVSLPPDVVRTGSADKHLVSDDEPVAPQPASRPRSYRDLDAIPDDYD
jgi:ribonuclease E